MTSFCTNRFSGRYAWFHAHTAPWQPEEISGWSTSRWRGRSHPVCLCQSSSNCPQPWRKNIKILLQRYDRRRSHFYGRIKASSPEDDCQIPHQEPDWVFLGLREAWQLEQSLPNFPATKEMPPFASTCRISSRLEIWCINLIDVHMHKS